MVRKNVKAHPSTRRDRSEADRELLETNRELSIQVQSLRSNQRTLEQARAHFADLFDFAPVTYALLDTVGIVLKVNLAGCRLLNVERAHLIGHPLLPFAIQPDRRALFDHLRRCRNGSGMVESEVRFAAVGGRVVTCRLHSKQAAYDGREAFPTVIIDETEHLALDEARLIAEGQRAQAERDSEIAHAASAAKDRFLATVSHELRTPLTPALFAASRLATWQELPDEARLLAATIQRNIEFEARLIDDLLDIAGINRDRVDLRLETVDVHDVLREAVAVCTAFAKAKNVNLTVHLVAPAHHVSGDRARLRQVFWNLLNNAIKFTEAGGRVSASTVNGAEGNLRVSVHDSGVGMDESVVETLFAPFDRRPVKRGSRGGLGLGLAICKGIVAAHEGQIWARSDGSGRGSMFAVALATVSEPAVDPSPWQSTPKVLAHSAEVPLPQRVLLIEDDPDSREMLSLFLAHSGYEVEVASTLADAIRKLSADWDIVLSDIGLPDGSGLEVARRARRKAHPPQRLIAFTGCGSDEDARASHEAGFDDHVVKPIELDRLLKSLEQVKLADT